jgi:hypothetical protein
MRGHHELADHLDDHVPLALVGTVDPLAHVDPFAEHLTPAESVALHMCMDKVQRYIAKGRVKEAHGARSMVLIMWQALMLEPAIDTGWGEL